MLWRRRKCEAPSQSIPIASCIIKNNISVWKHHFSLSELIWRKILRVYPPHSSISLPHIHWRRIKSSLEKKPRRRKLLKRWIILENIFQTINFVIKSKSFSHLVAETVFVAFCVGESEMAKWKEKKGSHSEGRLLREIWLCFLVCFCCVLWAFFTKICAECHHFSSTFLNTLSLTQREE